MKKVIPFKKDIIFNTNIGEIHSISLEHFIEKQEEYEIKGYFVVSGDYRITEASINIDPFEYKLPFDISIDKKYNVDDIEVDIDNFYYEVTNNKILSVSIELAVDKLEEKEEEESRVEEVEEKIEEVREETLEEVKEETAKDIKEEKEIERCVEPEETTMGIFNSSETEGYKTYKIYLVKESDTLESIMENYSVTRESLEMYNDLSSIKLGDKLIIPSA